MNHLSDTELKSFSLGMWANHVETGHVGMSAADARNQIENVRRTPAEIRALGFEVKSLTPDQQAFVLRLRTLSTAALVEHGRPSMVEPEAGSFLRSRARGG